VNADDTIRQCVNYEFFMVEALIGALIHKELAATGSRQERCAEYYLEAVWDQWFRRHCN
jgi:hypothetical protein